MRDILGKFIFAIVMLTVIVPPIRWGLVVIGAVLILFVPHWWCWLVGGLLVAVGLIARTVSRSFKI
jgi:hypothetical protein